MRAHSILPLVLSLAALPFCKAQDQDEITLAQLREADRNREARECASVVLGAMVLAGGSQAADVGAGHGYYSERMSEIVQREGHVFAVDISEVALRLLRERFREPALSNVTVIEGREDDPLLPQNRLDAILVMRTYQYFKQPREMLRHMRDALKPGGRLVVVDYRNVRSKQSDPREVQVKEHELAMAIAESELKQAGFRVMDARDPLCRTGIDPSSDRILGDHMWLIIAVRPPDRSGLGFGATR